MAKARHPFHSLAEFLGVFRLKCSHCGTRFRRTWGFSEWLLAKCPRCLGTKLSSWNPKYYFPTGSVAFKVALGARRVRCDSCRVNFATFRFVRRRNQQRAAQGVSVGNGVTG
ncbi:MAG: hypothetical protein SFV54_12800 [Bryobacteraceae bacterium]|nr:hypothetical protein [Bryobacteraceae bacterium]